ncbi:hypothetical protein H1R20_g10581, partial [Candolleomyces eurysporus]
MDVPVVPVPIKRKVLMLSKLELVLTISVESAPEPALNLPWAHLKTLHDRLGDRCITLVDSQPKELRMLDRFVTNPDRFPLHMLSTANIQTLRFEFLHMDAAFNSAWTN